MKEYITWKNKKGDLFDPWLRLHTRVGGKIAKVCPHSMQVTRPSEAWQNYTTVEIIGSGDYLITDGLTTVKNDIANDIGIYNEPNV